MQVSMVMLPINIAIDIKDNTRANVGCATTNFMNKGGDVTANDLIRKEQII